MSATIFDAAAQPSAETPAPGSQSSCCGPRVQASCCEPAAKPSCCGSASAGGCGCSHGNGVVAAAGTE
jgi:hypothetical protein